MKRFFNWITTHDSTESVAAQAARPLTCLVILFGLLLIFALCGCASFHTTQTETGTNGVTKTTRVSIRSFFDSHNDVTKLRTTFTDKSQGIGVGAISENTSGSNVVEIVIRGANVATKALVP